MDDFLFKVEDGVVEIVHPPFKKNEFDGKDLENIYDIVPGPFHATRGHSSNSRVSFPAAGLV